MIYTICVNGKNIRQCEIYSIMLQTRTITYFFGYTYNLQLELIYSIKQFKLAFKRSHQYFVGLPVPPVPPNINSTVE